MRETIRVSETFPVPAKKLFESWLSSEDHTNFTGSAAEIDNKNGGNFTAGDGYITGVTRSIQPYSRIVQSWRTTDFPEACSDSNLEILFEKTDEGTRLIIIHSEIPTGQGKDYEKGWKEYYFKPMKKFFKKEAVH